jgi:hypothetical protein
MSQMKLIQNLRSYLLEIQLPLYIYVKVFQVVFEKNVILDIYKLNQILSTKFSVDLPILIFKTIQ